LAKLILVLLKDTYLIGDVECYQFSLFSENIYLFYLFWDDCCYFYYLVIHHR